MRITVNRPYYADTLGIDDPDGVIRGIYVGSCVDERNAWGIWNGVRSHAHNHTGYPWVGWACFLNPDDVLTPSGKITATLAHEIAHLMVIDELHTRRWKRAVSELGFASEIARCGLAPLRKGH